MDAGRKLDYLGSRDKGFHGFAVVSKLRNGRFGTKTCYQGSGNCVLFNKIGNVASFHPRALVSGPCTPGPIVGGLFIRGGRMLPSSRAKVLGRDVACIGHVALSSSRGSFTVSFIISGCVTNGRGAFACGLRKCSGM